MVQRILNTFLKQTYKETEKYICHPFDIQEKVFRYLIKNGSDTQIGHRYNFNSVKSFDDFRNSIPIHRYEDIKPFIEKIIIGKEKNVLWNKPVKWFAMSSGTTADKSKYIPVTKDALRDCHYKGGRQMVAQYLINHPDSCFVKGKTLVLGGSQQINAIGRGIYTGDISAILVKNLPFFARFSRTPSRDIILLSDWEEKLEKLMQYAIKDNVTAMAGVPSWLLVLLKQIIDVTQKDITEIWSNLEVFFHGGVSFSPYEKEYQNLISSPKMNYWETYNASEGFLGFQYERGRKDMLLMLDSGIYYEFLPMSEWDKEQPQSLTLSEVEKGENYAVVITTNGGLWRYLIGDTIEFTSLSPFLFKLTGRTKHFINAFGEEVIIDNAEKALFSACKATNSIISEYTAAPIYFTDKNNGTHEWLIEFSKEPKNLNEFTELLDKELQNINSDYEAKRSYNLSLSLPKVISVPQGTFYSWLHSKGKVGGQNKIPRLSNDRRYIDELKIFIN